MTVDEGPWPRNQRIWRWFDSDRIVPALLGKGDYFIPSHQWGDHDLILVIGQLMDWVDEHDKAESAADALRKAVTTHVEANDAAAASLMVWAVVILEEDKDRVAPASAQELAALLPALPHEADAETIGTAELLAQRGLIAKRGLE